MHCFGRLVGAAPEAEGELPGEEVELLRRYRGPPFDEDGERRDTVALCDRDAIRSPVLLPLSEGYEQREALPALLPRGVAGLEPEPGVVVSRELGAVVLNDPAIDGDVAPEAPGGMFGLSTPLAAEWVSPRGATGAGLAHHSWPSG